MARCFVILHSMKLSERVVNGAVSLFFRLTCKVKIEGTEFIPATGPAILIANHTHILEGPLFYVSLRPRRTIALAKMQLWDKPLTRMAMNAWGSIPVDREGLDIKAVRGCLRVLDDGNFLCIAPEGTRSKTGALKQALPGTIFFASRKSVPIYPMVQWGLQDLSKNLKRLRRTEVNFRVGKPFVFEKAGAVRFTADDRRKMADEMMFHMAELLPEELRGYYADESKRTSEFVKLL